MLSRWKIFDSGECILEEQVEKNPAYPFSVLYIDASDNSRVYEYTRRGAYFYYALVGLIASFFCIVLLVAGRGEQVCCSLLLAT